MRHLGDITQMRGAEIPAVKVVIGGSPCQDLSVAGRRAGLAGERSGLFMEQLRIIKEMRGKDAENGRSGKNIRPRYMVWENVPGAFSSAKGADFAAVLRETLGVVCEAPAVPMPKNGWPTAGCLTDMGGQWSIAWRVLDAQFWGVPQRRRRIALVADFGGLTAPEILFEREGVCGDFTESGTARESASGDPESRVGATVYDARGDGRIAPTITGDHNNRITDYSSVIVQSAGFCGKNSATAAGIGFRDEQAPTLTTAKPLDVLYAIDRAAFNQGENARYDFTVSDDGINSTLVSKDPSAICIQGNCIDRAETAGCNGKGWTEDVSYTLNTIDRHAVAHEVATLGRVAGTLDASYYKGAGCRNGVEREIIAEAYSIGNGQSDNTGLHEIPGALNCMHDQQAVLTRSTRKWIVRRLTPLECERLQGYPDGWTDIGSWTDLRGKLRDSADSARYKALGNSIALPPWVFVLSRLTLACGAECTMGSLFDGIGGFPLIWERLNGAGSCLWASEIDEFAIAVTKKRFCSEVVSESRKET